MKLLQLFAIGMHGVIAGTHVHECTQPGGFASHRLIQTSAYVTLVLVQIVLFFLAGRRRETPTDVTVID